MNTAHDNFFCKIQDTCMHIIIAFNLRAYNSVSVNVAYSITACLILLHVASSPTQKLFDNLTSYYIRNMIKTML